MAEHDHEGFYWEPSAEDDLRQGDLLFNVPIALMPQRPRFVLGPGEDVKTESYDDYPENAPSDQIVVEAVFGALGMVHTPTCHIAEGEKDREIVAVVPGTAAEPRNPVARRGSHCAGRQERPATHLFPLPRTELGGGILRFNGVALLDRPASMLKENLRDYRRLGLYVESRIALRKGDGALLGAGERGREHRAFDAGSEMENRPLEDLE